MLAPTEIMKEAVATTGDKMLNAVNKYDEQYMNVTESGKKCPNIRTFETLYDI